MTRASLLLVLVAAPAFAEGGWLTARGRLAPEVRLEAWGGNLSFGVGLIVPDVKSQALTVEALYAFRDRTLELRGGRSWQFTTTGFATASATLVGVAHVVPEGQDVGVGPHGMLALSLGGKVFTVDLALESGAEFFFHAALGRFPQRGVLGLNLRLGDFGFSAQAKIGADIVLAGNAVVRGELVLSVSWFGAKL
ncbi:MAG: hypothetical protein QM817_30190 [Archangium sp.]